MAALCSEGRTSLICFLAGVSLFLTSLIGLLGQTLEYIWEDFKLYIIFIYIVTFNVTLLLVYKDCHSLYKVGVRGGFLGCAFAIGLMIAFSGSSWIHFGCYLAAISFFHWSEYFVTAVSNPNTLTLDSYLLDHSREYKLAALCSLIEFVLEIYIFPGLKQLSYISIIGLCLVVGGDTLRKASMYTASTNFNHYVQYEKHEGHILVTWGVYSLFRHPAYVGWFYWSIGTQILLCNPICLVGYTMASWRFFKERVQEEEIYLLNFFGEDYVDYQRRVGTGLPFINGYRGQV
ncbi:hypothetical protein CHS0354_025998 [Potamilus streckersoni]|uniref:Protein-S-isoprenylcysteine O-methyltransferase n=1 Tax=Potamilus streckersoni TaxID=2493646 RepID=A0AAE0RYI0_9BIVA|nr:hypothetical protein CHS0354_025998 [Potamilus streckersoni]